MVTLYVIGVRLGIPIKYELGEKTIKSKAYANNSDSASPSKMIPEPSAEVLKARTAQALRAFLCAQFFPRSLKPTN